MNDSSLLDLLTYNRGSDDVWNRWANLTQDEGWSWNSVNKYYLKVLSVLRPGDRALLNLNVFI